MSDLRQYPPTDPFFSPQNGFIGMPQVEMPGTPGSLQPPTVPQSQPPQPPQPARRRFVPTNADLARALSRRGCKRDTSGRWLKYMGMRDTKPQWASVGKTPDGKFLATVYKGRTVLLLGPFDENGALEVAAPPVPSRPFPASSSTPSQSSPGSGTGSNNNSSNSRKRTATGALKYPPSPLEPLAQPALPPSSPATRQKKFLVISALNSLPLDEQLLVFTCA